MSSSKASLVFSNFRSGEVTYKTDQFITTTHHFIQQPKGAETINIKIEIIQKRLIVWNETPRDFTIV